MIKLQKLSYSKQMWILPGVLGWAGPGRAGLRRHIYKTSKAKFQ